MHTSIRQFVNNINIGFYKNDFQTLYNRFNKKRKQETCQNKNARAENLARGEAERTLGQQSFLAALGCKAS